MKSKNTFKKFITCMLIAAIAITGISLESVTTANAAAKYEQLEKGCTITMKVGETKRFLMTDEDGKDLVVNTAWKTSDKNIVSIETDFADENCITEYIQFTANAEGTAIIGGRSAADYAIDWYNGFQRESCPDDFSITVKVVKPDVKMTAKQKKCKHTWKTLRKATCQRVGTKVCKKCKLQKTVKKTNHKWETIETSVYVTTDIVCDKWYGEEYDCEPDETVKLSDYIPAEQLTHARVVETVTSPMTVDYDIVNLPEGTEEAKEAFFKECFDEYTMNYFFVHEVYGSEMTTETNTICEYCGKSK